MRVFDVYHGPQVEGRKSLAFAVEFQSAERTLSDEDAAALQQATDRRRAARAPRRGVTLGLVQSDQALGHRLEHLQLQIRELAQKAA